MNNKIHKLFLIFFVLGTSIRVDASEVFGPEPLPSASAHVPLPSPSPSPKMTTTLPLLLKEVEKKYSKSETLEADFVQINETKTTGQKKKSTGVILFKRPDKVRWETHTPDKSLLVSDGKTAWHYTPPFDEEENGQVIIRKAAELNTRLTHALLSGRFSSAKDMEILDKGSNRFILLPKRGSAGTVKEAEIEIDPAEKVIRKITLEHKGGNRSEITLTKVELGKNLPEPLFHFEIPPNTDRITE